MARSVRFVCLHLVLLFVTLSISAQVEADAASDARNAFKQGVEASREGRWQEAHDQFERSRSLVVKPSTLFNLAVADLKLGLVDEALAALDEFERIAKPAEHGEMLERSRTLRAEAERTVEAAKPAGERVRGLVDPTGLATAQHVAFEQGRDAYAQGDDQLALDKFTEAYESSGRAELLYDIGMVADRLREDQRAIDAFERFVRERPESPEAALAKKRIERLRRELARQQSGPQTVAVADSGEEPTQRVASAPNLMGPRTLIAVGAVLGAGAIGSVAWWAERKGALDDCQRANQICDNKSTIEGHANAAKGASIGLGVGAAALIVGGAVWLHNRKHPTHVTPTLDASAGRWLVGANARF